ncbi:MAG TPA: hypothetical protein VNN76_11170 [Bacteroidota bacterium]|nr:hypothetical protein [Bacteroidota bacterium]
MSAIDELNWFLENIEKETNLCEWLEEQKKEILLLKTENERQRAVRRLIIEYVALHRKLGE